VELLKDHMSKRLLFCTSCVWPIYSGQSKQLFTVW